LRWEHPRLGTLNPAHFVPVAEESDLIAKLGSYLLTRAAASAQRWQRELLRPDQPVFVSIAIASRRLFQPELINEVRHVLGRAVMPKGSLRLEIAETLVMENPERARGVLEQLGAAGAGLALDEFGTGYSSLSYLNQLPFDTVKVDRAFVQARGQNAGGGAMLRSIVALAKELGRKVGAEGVEAEDDIAFLRSIGCEYAQGVYYGELMADRDVSQLLKVVRRAERRQRKTARLFRQGSKPRLEPAEAPVAALPAPASAPAALRPAPVPQPPHPNGARSPPATPPPARTPPGPAPLPPPGAPGGATLQQPLPPRAGPGGRPTLLGPPPPLSPPPLPGGARVAPRPAPSPAAAPPTAPPRPTAAPPGPPAAAAPAAARPRAGGAPRQATPPPAAPPPPIPPPPAAAARAPTGIVTPPPVTPPATTAHRQPAAPPTQRPGATPVPPAPPPGAARPPVSPVPPPPPRRPARPAPDLSKLPAAIRESLAKLAGDAAPEDNATPAAPTATPASNTPGDR
ncbi:MAG TPA: EAL domain-containing protein, partial [Hyphomicrobiaceae bacterium]|nr:EAL domain-containing protein [Hyphomicrobiaceae bacterium]